jgi:hypothetical protein
MAKENIELIGYKELQRAIDKNPRFVVEEGNKFIVRGLAAYKRGIIRNPWQIASHGGGAPVASGNLRDTHRTTIGTLTGKIAPNEDAAPYAKYVALGTRYMRRRPWLEYVKKNKESEIQKLYRNLLATITAELAK